ncbi:hypothetical protein [Anaeropeptidivorans aminofermentans]|uniref:hypothetical protein n=1 Tax=Anaeropeptidivorans aminofermentans TaxID=2934315 RepID=UPI00202435B7|nr:hypothetical protein [Anaeropeptidivorans aminofermentans]
MKEKEIIHIQIYSHEYLDKLLDISREYSLPLDYMINVAIKRLTNDVEAMRRLRANMYEL